MCLIASVVHVMVHVDQYKTDEPVSGNRSVYQTITFYHIVKVPGTRGVALGFTNFRAYPGYLSREVPGRKIKFSIFHLK